MPGKPVSAVKSLSQPSYQKLLALLRKEIARGQERINTYIDFEKVRTNWNVGRHIDVHLLDGADRAPAGLYQDLGRDLNISTTYIQNTVRFYRLYPKLPGHDGLSWTHYTLLMRLTDPAKREKLRQRAIKERMSVKNLTQIVRRPGADPADTAVLGRTLKAERGTLYAYHIIKTDSIHGHESITLDCGFEINYDQVLDPQRAYRSGNICVSTKNGEEYALALSKSLRIGDLYTYKAEIERFLDGDTLYVKVDVGFGITTHQTLRLRGIDCPELGTEAGNNAKTFVCTQLKDCPFIVIKTYKSDKYDRYLVDIFYLPKEEDPAKVAAHGKYLNQELIDKGLAKVW